MRRLRTDDGKGVGEPLNDISPNGKGLQLVGWHYVTWGPEDSSLESFERKISLEKQKCPEHYYSDMTDVPFSKFCELTNIYSGLSKPLPKKVDVTTMQPWKDGTLLMRFENFHSTGAPAEVCLDGLLNGIEIVSVQETTLGGNEPIGDLVTECDDLTITLEPLEIRTFILQVQPVECF